MTKSEERRATILAKLAKAEIATLGPIVVPTIPGTVLDPVAVFLDPGKLQTMLKYWERRAGRDGCGDGLPKHLRKAACEQAAQVCLTYFLDANYKALGITENEIVRAMLMAFKLAKRRFWKDAAGHADAERARRQFAKAGGDFNLFNRAQNSRTADPARLFHAADAMGLDTVLIVDGAGCDDIPGKALAIPGGPSGRGETDGKIECVVVRDIVTSRPGGAFCQDREELQHTDTRWRMKRGRGKARKLPPCLVIDGQPANRGRYRQPAPGTMTVPRDSGPRSMLPAVGPDLEIYREALREYYAAK
jgi:hypothetical protein